MKRLKVPKLRVIALILIVVGLVVPVVIDKYETANHLDISRDIGVLPWLILTGLGVFLFLYSLFRNR